MSVHINSNGTSTNNGALSRSSPGVGSRGFTACGFVSWNNLTGFRTVFSMAPAGDGDWIEFASENTQLVCWVNNTNLIPATITLVANTWYFVAISVTSAGSAFAAIGVAGSNALNFYTFSNTVPSFTPDILQLGGIRAFPTESHVGKMHGWRVWNTDLTQAEVALESYQWVPRRWTNLYGFFPLVNTGTGYLNDLSGQGHALTQGSVAPADFAGNGAVPYTLATSRRRILKSATVVGPTDGFALFLESGSKILLESGFGLDIEETQTGPTVHDILGSIAGTSTITGAPTKQIYESGAIAGVTAVTGSPTKIVYESGLVAGVTTIVSVVSHTTALAGAIAGVTAITGDPTKQIYQSGLIAGTSSVTGAPTKIVYQSGIIAGSTSITEAIHRIAAISGAIAGLSTITGAPTKQIYESGTIAGASSVTGVLTRLVSEDGIITGTSALVGEILKTIYETGSISGLTSLVGVVDALAPANDITGSIQGSSTITGAIQKTTYPVGTITGIGTITGNPSLVLYQTGAIAGVGSVTGAPTQQVNTTGVIAGTSSLTGQIVKSISESGLVAGGTSIVGVLVKTVYESGAIAGQSQVTGVLAAIRQMIGTIAGQTQIVGRFVDRLEIAGTISGISTVTGEPTVLIFTPNIIGRIPLPPGPNAPRLLFPGLSPTPGLVVDVPGSPKLPRADRPVRAGGSPSVVRLPLSTRK